MRELRIVCVYRLAGGVGRERLQDEMGGREGCVKKARSLQEFGDLLFSLCRGGSLSMGGRGGLCSTFEDGRGRVGEWRCLCGGGVLGRRGWG